MQDDRPLECIGCRQEQAQTLTHVLQQDREREIWVPCPKCGEAFTVKEWLLYNGYFLPAPGEAERLPEARVVKYAGKVVFDAAAVEREWADPEFQAKMKRMADALRHQFRFG